VFFTLSQSWERCILFKAARETGRAEILIIATGSEHAVGWHRTSFITLCIFARCER